MPETKITRFFPESICNVIHQDGTQLTDTTNGVEVVLHLRNGVPRFAEIISGDHYADIGLTIEGKELVDYDGVFELPKEILLMLKELGYTMEEA